MIEEQHRRWILGSVAFVVLATITNLVVAQDKTSNSDSLVTSRQFSNQLWDYLLSNNYKHWSPAQGREPEHYFSLHDSILGKRSSHRRTQTQHGTLLKSYVNRTASAKTGSLPIGSIVILENYHEDKSLESITVMYKTKGFNPNANDWYWVKYNPDGSVANKPIEPEQIVGQTVVDPAGTQYTQAARVTAPPTKLNGRIQSCIQCHQRAGGGDLVFFNDRHRVGQSDE